MNNKFLYKILLFFSFQVIFANNTNIFWPAENDLSVRLLMNLFPLNGISNVPLIGALMRIMNMGMIAIVAVVVGYMAILATLGSNIESMGYGRKLKLWNLMRTAGGALCLAPLANGLSILQQFILWLTFNGIGLADTMWTDLSSMLFEGVSSFSLPNDEYWTNFNKILGQPSSGRQASGIFALASSSVCLRYMYYNDLSQGKKDADYMIRKDLDCGDNFHGICFGSNDNKVICGDYRVSSNGTYRSDILYNVALNIQNTFNTSFDSLYDNIIYNPNYSFENFDCANSLSATCILSTNLMSSASQYLTSVDIFRQKNYALTANANIYTDFTQYGWALAGYYYSRFLGKLVVDANKNNFNFSDYVFTSDMRTISINNACYLPDNKTIIPIEKKIYCFLINSLLDSSSVVNKKVKVDFYNIQSGFDSLRNNVGATDNIVLLTDQSGKIIYKDPSDKYLDTATALILKNTIYGVSAPKVEQVFTSSMDGIIRSLMSSGSSITGSNYRSSFNVALNNLYNVASCATQAMLGVRIFDDGCFFDGVMTPKSFSCTSKDVLKACSEPPYTQCFAVAFKNDCIIKDINNMGMLGLFAYNMKDINAYNPMTVMVNIGQALYYAALNSMMQGASVSLQMLIDAGIGLSVMKIPAAMVNVVTHILASVGIGRHSLFLFLTSAAARNLNTIFDISYQLLLFNMRFMFDVFMMVNGLVMGFGALFSLYLPAVPMIIYTLSVIGWIAMIIEGLVAAPIIAAGMAYPEGAAFLGVAEQSFYLAFSIFLRPSLLILGLYFASSIAQIGILMLNYSMLYFLYFLLTTFSVFNDVAISIPVMFMLSFVYVYLAFEILVMSYTFITFLPDKINKWFLGGVSETIWNLQINSVLSGIKDASQSQAENVARNTPVSQGVRMPPVDSIAEQLVISGIGATSEVYGLIYGKNNGSKTQDQNQAEDQNQDQDPTQDPVQDQNQQQNQAQDQNQDQD